MFRPFARVFIAIALALLVSTPVHAASPFTMAQVLSAPFVDDLTASPDGKAIAFTANERGMHNIFFSSGSEARKITPYSADDGQIVGSLAIVPGNRAVVYVRGEGTNRRSEYPNPLSLAIPPKQTIWVVSASGGQPVRVGEGNSPAVSPGGDRIVWILGGQPYSATLETSGAIRTGKPSRLFSIRGSLSDPQFSPDGSRLAFTNSRGDHSFIALYDLRSNRISYAAPYFAHDIAPAWSPDSRQIAFIRTPGTLENEDPYVDYVKEPWSIWIAGADGSGGHQIWQADRGMGSVFYGTDSAAQLFWSNNGQIAFPWEKDGWRHLYSIASSGGSAQLLTPGQFEVENATVALDHSRVIVSSNENDIDRRHIWSAGFDASPPAQITTGSDSQWTPAALASGAVAYVNAGYKNPPAVFVMRGEAATALGGPAVPPEFPANDLVEPQLVTFHAPDGLLIHAQLFVPQDGLTKHCAVIFDHGGSRRQMLPGFHYLEFYTDLYESNQYYANHGCVVLSINYRSGIMYGHNFREAKNYGAEGGSEYQDVLAGAAYLRNRSDVDPARMGIYGLSYGGYLTALGLARNSDIFKAGVDMAGVHNWATTRDADYGRAVGTAAERKIAEDSSPVSAIDTWRSPVFMSQGDDDRNVEFSQGVDLATRLRAKGVEVVEMVFPNETHENLKFADTLQLYDTSAAWLLKKLGAP
ncbi:MAG TPA: prolyl oligopeptidase family serine peptidase [Candidatus Rubrimentiphilum sp.]|nr:prolyl oligopeptidase family serine peptidase [Candidatus Rubrimentiphilum sp.]